MTVRTAPTGVSLNASTLNLNAGAGAQLTATVSPGTASNKSVTWSSSNTAVATVNGSGYVTAVGNGTATITVKTAEGGKIANCTVTVRTAPTGVSLNATTLNLNAGAGAQLTATVSPGTASNKSVTWSSSNTAVATVNGSGYVTAVGNGTATITVKTAEGGKIANCTVNVTTKPTGVSITNKKNVILDCDSSSKTYQCNITVSPSTASNKSVTWSSSNTGVATVNGNGLITAVGVGTATITVKTNASGHQDTINVYVYESKAVAPGGTFRVSIGSTTNRVMDVDKANAYNGAKVQLYSVNSSTGQMWEFHDYSSSNGGYAIVPKCNTAGHILDVNRGNSYSDPLQAGCKVDLWLIGQDNPASMFDLVRFWDGSYAFKLINSNLVVGVTSTGECTQLVAKNFDVNDMNQRWFLEKVETSSGNTTDAVTTKIASLRNVYKHGQYWNQYNGLDKTGTIVCPCGTATCYGNDTCACGQFYFNGGWVAGQCHGFALKMAYELFGENANTWSRHTNTNSIYAGDVIRINNDTHTIFVIKVDGDNIYYVDCNWTGRCQVRWDGCYTRSQLASKVTYIAHKSGNNSYGK